MKIVIENKDVYKLQTMAKKDFGILVSAPHARSWLEKDTAFAIRFLSENHSHTLDSSGETVLISGDYDHLADFLFWKFLDRAAPMIVRKVDKERLQEAYSDSFAPV